MQKRILKKLSKTRNYEKVRDHFLYTGKYSVCNLKFNMRIEILLVSYNSSNYDYHFITDITEDLANECEEKFERLGKNTEKI